MVDAFVIVNTQRPSSLSSPGTISTPIPTMNGMFSDRTDHPSCRGTVICWTKASSSSSSSVTTDAVSSIGEKVAKDRWFPHSLLYIIGTEGNNKYMKPRQGPDDDDDDKCRTEQELLELDRLEEESIQLMADLVRSPLQQQQQQQEQEQQRQSDDTKTSNDDDDSTGRVVAEERDDDSDTHQPTELPMDDPQRQLDDTGLDVAGSNNNNTNTSEDVNGSSTTSIHRRINVYELVHGRFIDLCSTPDGEQILESLFLPSSSSSSSIIDNVDDERIIRGAVLSLQSLLVLGTSYGVAMNAELLERSVSHMREDTDPVEAEHDALVWTRDSTRRFKYVRPTTTNGGRDNRMVPPTMARYYPWKTTAGLQLLAKMGKRRSPLGAYDVLVKLGVWNKHECLPLLRGGFPLRFTKEEEEIASVAASTDHDPDTILGIRQDYRHQKLYTIDGASASEIDDALGVEVLDNNNNGGGGCDDGDDGSSSSRRRYRYWIHIADADRWAPRNSELFQVARKRATSIYLPNDAIPMMPSRVSGDVMSLKANTDVCALSLGVELNDDGSIIDSSIIVTPSQVRVSYRLTYDDVDEMLEDGVGYQEEWELGQLFAVAQTRRKFRMKNGSSESFMPIQIPKYAVSVFPDPKSEDNLGIKIDIEVSNNGGKNHSAVVAEAPTDPRFNVALANEIPVSSAWTLVTEMMILAGEAIGKWAQYQEKLTNDVPDGGKRYPKNRLSLPYRGQSKPDYRSRSRERKIMMDLMEYNVGGGYCHAWYCRRFLAPVKIDQNVVPHFGLGLDCYVQWTSPIRRYQDLQVHAAVKRYLRRKKIIDMVAAGNETVSTMIDNDDLGCPPPAVNEDSDGIPQFGTDELVDHDIDYRDRTKVLGPAGYVMKASNKYWMLEYIRRLYQADSGTMFEALVLGCVNPASRQYAVYVYQLGLEWKYTSPVGLQAGIVLKLRVGNVIPQNGQLTFVRVQ